MKETIDAVSVVLYLGFALCTLLLKNHLKVLTTLQKILIPRLLTELSQG